MPEPRVLLLEDDAPLLSVLLELFLDEQIDVTVCNSLADIYAALERYPSAVIVTDSWADQRSVELSDDERRELLALDQAATVILTSGRAWADIRQVDGLGNVRIIHKPYELEELVRTVRAAARDGTLSMAASSRPR